MTQPTRATPRGLDATQEMSVIRNIARHALADTDDLDTEDMEIDQFSFNVTTSEKPHIQNDTVTLHRRVSA